VVLRDLAPIVGRGGEVVGIDPSRTILDAARRLCRPAARQTRLTLRQSEGARLPFATNRFDVAVAITVILHVAEPTAVVAEMARVVRRGGRVGLQDQDFGMLAVTHPDRALTDHILDGVVQRLYDEPYSGRRLPRLLREAGLERVRLLTDFFQDTTLEPWTKTFLERRAAYAVEFGLVDAAGAQRWLDGFTTLVAAGGFVLTMTYYGAVGRKP
jgi:ubiquinone/menaquinone biosynthesis C-methylase UbiE